MAAAIHADAAAVVEKVGAGRDVDEADRAQSEFGRQRPGDQSAMLPIKLVSKMLPKPVTPSGSNHSR